MLDTPPPPDRSAFERLFLAQLPWIQKFAGRVCRRHGWNPSETEEFTARVIEKMLADDYAVFRKHRGESSLPTYLGTVISRFFQDYCDQLWGRWRPSEKARQLGPAALLLERLTDRDRQSFELAAETVLRKFPELTREALDRIWNELPNRTRRRIEGEETLDRLSSQASTPQEQAIERESRRRAQTILERLQQGMAKLPAEDRLLLNLHFGEGWQVSCIARRQQLEEKPLYRRIERLRRGLRQDLEDAGIRREELGEVLRGMGIAFLPRKRGKSPRHPSNSKGTAPSRCKDE